MINPIRLRQYRGDSRWPVPIAAAVRQYRYANTEAPFEWLDRLSTYDDMARGTYKGLDATVSVWSDYDSGRDEDDVTGTFTDQEEPGVTLRDTYRGGWYRPPTYLLEPGGIDYPKGLAKGDRPIYKQWRLEKAMDEDRERSWHGITVVLSYEGIELARESIGGIDLSSTDAQAYLWECAEETLDNALYLIDAESLDKRITELHTKITALRQLRADLPTEVTP